MLCSMWERAHAGQGWGEPLTHRKQYGAVCAYDALHAMCRRSTADGRALTPASRPCLSPLPLAPASRPSLLLSPSACPLPTATCHESFAMLEAAWRLPRHHRSILHAKEQWACLFFGFVVCLFGCLDASGPGITLSSSVSDVTLSSSLPLISQAPVRGRGTHRNVAVIPV